MWKNVERGSYVRIKFIIFFGSLFYMFLIRFFVGVLFIFRSVFFWRIICCMFVLVGGVSIVSEVIVFFELVLCSVVVVFVEFIMIW